MKTTKTQAPARRNMLVAPLAILALAGVAQLAAQTTPAQDPSTVKNPAEVKPVPVETKTVKSDGAKGDDDIVTLSPFEVVSDTKGYYSANTMSGTRFNTKLEDLASSISVVTKGQMQDFAMLDANDVFLYVAGTEGTGTYTDVTLDRNGSLSDNTQLNPTMANRVRGIAPANVSLGNIETMGRVPVDPITIDSLEISRGPNANVFGLGNPSGTINQVAASAGLNRNKYTTELRADSFDGYRSSLDLNQVLIKGKLAIRGSAVNQHEGFQQKPSGVDTERYNGMIKYQPFKNTTISASTFYYHSYGNRPNSLPPRDNISYWLASGSPTWDPVTQQIHRPDGTLIGTYTAATYNGPDYFTASYLGNDQSQMFIDQTGLTYWSTPRGTTSTSGPSLATLQAGRYLQPTAAAGATFSGTAPRPTSQPLFNTTPTISDKSIYDWSSINLAAPNRFWDTTTTSTATIDQMFINDSTQMLAAQVTFMREDSKRWARNLIGIANDNGQSGQLTIDINERRLDGTPNPYFLHPYLSVSKPRIVSQPAKWDTSRAQLAYRLDLTHQDSFLKNLGLWQFTGYAEYKYRVNRQYSWREAMASGATFIPSGTYRGYQSVPTGTPAIINLTQGLYRFYVGGKGDQVQYAPGDFHYGIYNFVWGNVATNSFKSEPIDLDLVAADKTGGSFNTKTVLKTVGGVTQSHLLGDHLIATFGLRQDKTFLKYGNPGNPTNAFVNSDGVTFNYALTDGWAPNYYNNGGHTTNAQFVLRPFADLGFTNRLAKAGGLTGFVGDLLNGLSLNYNKADSFLPLPPAQNLFQQLLPNPTGNDKSWGFRLNLFNNKLSISTTHYDNYQRNSQTTDASTMAQRVLRADVQVTGTSITNPPITLLNNVQDWVTKAHPTWSTDQVMTEVYSEMQLTKDQVAFMINSTPPVGTTMDVRSVGTEIEINYNPTRFWTVTASATDTKAINLNVSKTLAEWIAQRMKVWTTIVDQRDGSLWWTHRYAATGQTPQENFNAFVAAPYAVIVAQEGKSNPQIRRYNFRLANAYQLAGLTDNKWLKKMSVGGALRWEDKAAIGYYGVQSLPATITDLDPNRPIYDSAHTFVDAFINYKTKIWRDKIVVNYKFNARNIGQSCHLQPVGAFPDGTISTYRIVNPTEYIFSATFEL